jgi:DNA polymerase-2
VLVFDYKSLYPSIIRTFLIDPAGLIEGLAHPDDAASVPASRRALLAHRALPARHRATRVGRPRRSETRRNAPLSQALKIIMNAFYGVLGSTGCRFFDPRLRRRSRCAATRSCIARAS